MIRLIIRFYCQYYKLMGYATTRSNGSNRICLKEIRFACLITVNLILKTFVVEYLMQVSNLGPLLFLIYFNDLPHCLETTHSLIYLLMTQFIVAMAFILKLNNKTLKMNNWIVVLNHWILRLNHWILRLNQWTLRLYHWILTLN